MDEHQINKDITIASQPSAEELQGLSERGFRTVVNLRTLEEDGLVPDEERIVESSGLDYAWIPVSPATLDDLAVARFQGAVTGRDSTPAIVHCRGGGRAGIMVLLQLALQHGWSIERALEEGDKLHIAPAADSPYRAFFEDYLRRHSAGERANR